MAERVLDCSAALPAPDAAAQHVIVQVACVVQLLFNMVAEHRCVGRANTGFARIEVRMPLSGRVASSSNQRRV